MWQDDITAELLKYYGDLNKTWKEVTGKSNYCQIA